MPDSNDRVTQAILKQTLENNTKALERFDKRLDAIDTCIRSLENRMSVTETRLTNNEKDIEAISRKTDGWNLLNSVGAGAAAILAWFK